MSSDLNQAPVPHPDVLSEEPARAGAGTNSRVREILSRHGRLAAPVDQLEDGADLHGAGLTSLATVGLMLALEEHFDIEFPDALLSRTTFSSVDALVAAVESLRLGREQ
jgi:acyl carrier protein